MNKDLRKVKRTTLDVMLKYIDMGMLPVTVHHASNKFNQMYLDKHEEEFNVACVNLTLGEYEAKRLEVYDRYLGSFR